MQSIPHNKARHSRLAIILLQPPHRPNSLAFASLTSAPWKAKKTCTSTYQAHITRSHHIRSVTPLPSSTKKWPRPPSLLKYVLVPPPHEPLGSYSHLPLHRFVTTSPESLVFGHGAHACPGRFFASNEIKIVMIEMLRSWDFRLKGDTDMAGGANKRPENIVKDCKSNSCYSFLIHYVWFILNC